MSKQVKLCSFLFVFLPICGWGTSVLAQTPTNRVSARIDDAQVTTLQGNVHPMARGDFDQGQVSAETPMEHMVLQLQPSASQQIALDALVEAQHDPHSPSYHQWLTPAQYGSRFGASLSDVARISSWLTEHGFTINDIAVNHRQITFSGNAGQVEDTFHTQIHRFLVEGENHIANTQDPQIPSAMAGVVSGILSLHNFQHSSDIQSRVSLEVRPRYTSGNTHYLFPADWAAIYDLNPLYQVGTNGTGTSIAIVGRSNINVADVSTFRAASGLPARNPTVILVSTNPGLVSGDQDESTLDVEWAGAVAPGASVKFVVGASTSSTDGIDLSAQYVVNHAIATVMSTSYGSCEVDMGAAELAFYNSLWQQAASEGISSFVSSGDAGAAGCYGGSSSSASGTGVNGLCSSPYSTCVGGTEFNEGSNSTTYWSASNGAGSGSALNYIPEEVWNESATKGGSGLWASGGGASLFIASRHGKKV
jgi:subtilase family serine protease